MRQLLLLPLLVVGCVAPPSADRTFATAAEAGEEEAPIDLLAVEAPPAAAAAADDTVDVLSPVDWSADPPEGDSEGLILEAELICGLLDRVAPRRWQKRGDRWDELPSPDGARLRPGLEVCAGQSPKFLIWQEDHSIYIEAGGMGHTLHPSATEDLWAGEVVPLHGTTPDCDAAMAEYGLTWPVPLGLRLLSLG